jgi:hypothetical protein
MHAARDSLSENTSDDSPKNAHSCRSGLTADLNLNELNARVRGLNRENYICSLPFIFAHSEFFCCTVNNMLHNTLVV